MTKKERQKLIGLAKKLARHAKLEHKMASRAYEKESTGSNDELWNECFKKIGIAIGISHAASEFVELINQMDGAE